ncbi:MAG: hypothetical protein WBP54_13650, partial [Pelodictyon phaeoclathratiforme]
LPIHRIACTGELKKADCTVLNEKTAEYRKIHSVQTHLTDSINLRFLQKKLQYLSHLAFFPSFSLKKEFRLTMV